jgi:hypothetical protein
MTTIDEFAARCVLVRNEPDEAVRDARRWAPSRS